MSPIPRGATVAVTGAAGFIGGWVTRRLLERGYRVKACVRDFKSRCCDVGNGSGRVGSSTRYL
ncbi:MAG: NmrA family NAD(P)-binding protein [Dehalococcoidia bacterium]|nr:NmrA family NAD(P)-binding protein [Dehalococcoidia bacterium]